MPIRIHEIFADDDEKRKDLVTDITSLIRSRNPDRGYHNEGKGIYLLAYDINDSISKDTVLKIVYTIHEHDGIKEIIDVDEVIPNEELISLDFEKRESEDRLENEEWMCEYDGRKNIVETVNRHLIKGDLKGVQKVSLSAMPYAEIVFAQDIDKINEAFDWHNTEVKGFAEDYIGMGMLICTILSHRKVNLKLIEKEYSCIIAELNTGFGKMTAVFSEKYEDEIIDGHCVRMYADLKADFSCGDRAY